MLNIYPPYRQAVEAYVAKPGPNPGGREGSGDAEPVKLHPHFGNVMSSQAFAMNLAAPFLENPAWLTSALRALAGDALDASEAEVERVGVEVIDSSNYFNEPSERRSSPDIGVWWRAGRELRLLLIEVKYTEPGFGHCSSGTEGHAACDQGGTQLLASAGMDCPKTLEGRPYWRFLKEQRLFDESVLGSTPCCPFRYEGYQLMRYQVMAAAIEASESSEVRVDVVALHHPDNRCLHTLSVPIDGEDNVFQLWGRALTRPDRFHVWSAKDWVGQAGKDPRLGDWAHWMTRRYFP
jgi:hypothetical protein